MRRFIFFIGAAVASFAMILVIDSHLRYVPTVVGCVYLILAALSGLDTLGRRE
ncbi:MAG: hypothetical protein ABI912_11850 [Actinomycetota bacterium]